MKLICINCGKPWDLLEAHEGPGKGFERKGALITHCPTCACRLPYIEDIVERFHRQLDEIVGDGWRVDGDQTPESSAIENLVIWMFPTPD